MSRRYQALANIQNPQYSDYVYNYYHMDEIFENCCDFHKCAIDEVVCLFRMSANNQQYHVYYCGDRFMIESSESGEVYESIAPWEWTEDDGEDRKCRTCFIANNKIFVDRPEGIYMSPDLTNWTLTEYELDEDNIVLDTVVEDGSMSPLDSIFYVKGKYYASVLDSDVLFRLNESSQKWYAIDGPRDEENEWKGDPYADERLTFRDVLDSNDLQNYMC